jgi:hypothetical protein
MANIEATAANFFSTTLSAGISASTLTIPVASLGSLTSPAYIVIDPTSDSKREVILADGTWGGSSFVTSNLSNRGLSDGSAAGAQAHDSGTLVVCVPLSHYIRDLHDRMEAHAHTGGTDGTAVSVTAANLEAWADAHNESSNAISGTEEILQCTLSIPGSWSTWDLVLWATIGVSGSSSTNTFEFFYSVDGGSQRDTHERGFSIEEEDHHLFPIVIRSTGETDTGSVVIRIFCEEKAGSVTTISHDMVVRALRTS